MTKLVAITTCPTGVAHTYMAAEALEETAKDKGYEIKVETQGASGPENELNKQDISQADVVIIAAGKSVNKDRFVGKRVYEVGVEEAIKDPEKVISDAFDRAVFLDPNGQSTNAGRSAKNSVQGIYKHLMTGVSFMIPVIVAGGILLAISFLWGLNSADPKDPSYNAIAAALNAIGGGDGALGLMVPVLAAGIGYSIGGVPAITSGLMSGWVAKSIGAGFLGGMVGGFLAGYVTLYLINYIKIPKKLDSIKFVLIIPVLSVAIVGLLMTFVIGIPIEHLMKWISGWLGTMGTGNKLLLGIITGSMMAFDMGGPLNKSIFAFSMIAFDAGNFVPFAAVMAGGVTPPLAIALSTVIFKNKYTAEERESGKAAWVLGAVNITEGAIPFAVADPLRVIPCIMIGSSVASTLSLIFNCACRIPHGGLIAPLIPNVVDHPVLWVVSIICGTIVGAILLGIVKKTKTETEASAKTSTQLNPLDMMKG
ncbi:PTS fructose transporter subunit IIC [Lacticaseibacillus hegangensis]|uniref:PTS fructose transporter subunit IIC n=1 Tax=Lacticaseibacillus hegangensis TaxID=2486010 RepID=A0ABW4CX92_9LACO|nr:fructose-specific PTS transporter subunit EIIC [Lacticaseibacillus hegangensis]